MTDPNTPPAPQSPTAPSQVAAFTTSWQPTVVTPVVKAKAEARPDRGRKGAATQTVRRAAAIPTATLLIPTLFAFVMHQVPELAGWPYLVRLRVLVGPLVIDPLDAILRSVPASEGGPLLPWVVLVASAVGLAASTRASWGANPVVLWALGGITTVGMLVVAFEAARTPDGVGLAAAVLALHAAAAAAVSAVLGLRDADPDWARHESPRWRGILIAYLVTVLGPLAVGRTIAPPGTEVATGLQLVFKSDVPSWLPPTLNGFWIGIAVWAVAQVFPRPRWGRVSTALVVLALAIGPLRDAAHVVPLFAPGWSGWNS